MAKESDFLDGFIDILRTYVTQQRKQNGILEPLPELPAPQPVAAQQEPIQPKKVTEACPAEKSSEVVSIEVDDDDEETAEEQKTEESGDNCDDDGDDEKENTSDEERTVPPLNPIAAAVSRIIQKRPKHEKVPWCTSEIEAVKRHMMNFINQGNFPRKIDCMKVKEAEKEALSKRQWRDIRHFVNNAIRKKQGKFKETTSPNQQQSTSKPSPPVEVITL